MGNVDPNYFSSFYNEIGDLYGPVNIEDQIKTYLDELKTDLAEMKAIQDQTLTAVSAIRSCGTYAYHPTNVRLVGSDGHIGHSGRLEVYVNGRWGTVCDDMAREHGNTPTRRELNNIAKVVCKELGLSGGTGTSKKRYDEAIGSTRSHLPILMEKLGCTGSESSIFECKPTIDSHCHNCDHDEDIGVACDNPAR